MLLKHDEVVLIESLDLCLPNESESGVFDFLPHRFLTCADMPQDPFARLPGDTLEIDYDKLSSGTECAQD